jgi:hypothetical protein
MISVVVCGVPEQIYPTYIGRNARCWVMGDGHGERAVEREGKSEYAVWTEDVAWMWRGW